jgi:hypothetical protein
VTVKLAGEGKDIVVAMHSYGGIPGTESAKCLAKADRQDCSAAVRVIMVLVLCVLITKVKCALGHTKNSVAKAVAVAVMMLLCIVPEAKRKDPPFNIKLMD